MGLALVRLVTLTVLLAALPLGAQPQTALKVNPQTTLPANQSQLDGSEALFTVLAAINAAGYDANLDSNANSPLRKRIREAIASKHLDSVDELKKFMAKHHQDDPEAELSQYMSFALSVDGPPDFHYWFAPQEIPPDVRKLDGLNELIAEFYSEAGIADLWKQAQPELEQVIRGVPRRRNTSGAGGQCLLA